MKLNTSRWLLVGLFLMLLCGCDAMEDENEHLVPEVTAQQVVDRASLRTFVNEAKRIYPIMLENSSFAEVNAAFREEGGYWKHEDIYIYILDLQGNAILHAGNPALEGISLYNLQDLNGVLFTQGLIAAANRGGGYLEYYFDNPAITGDEVEGSLKVGYATTISSPGLNNGEIAMIGSGLYP